MKTLKKILPLENRLLHIADDFVPKERKKVFKAKNWMIQPCKIWKDSCPNWW